MRPQRRGLRPGDLALNRAHVGPYVDRLLAAEGLVLVFPVWNYGYPAILKGFLDRVFLPGVSFKLTNGRLWPALHNIHKLTAVTTYGGSRLRTILMGDPPRRHFKRSLRLNMKPGAHARYLALYDMNRATEAGCTAFLSKVKRAMQAF